ncbi:hypothetical protein RclHR1_16460004 [Rhizophagus clarus]|uniref:Uncharacterized protein n=1 Tax=Rhizophagus clarus TaxID=94130 RepID=A0A2Z6QHZ9_9GLOM|nr:hypothetical protein RclHR1_16460004 [Rhizophagus clarus]
MLKQCWHVGRLAGVDRWPWPKRPKKFWPRPNANKVLISYLAIFHAKKVLAAAKCQHCAKVTALDFNRSRDVTNCDIADIRLKREQFSYGLTTS